MPVHKNRIIHTPFGIVSADPCRTNTLLKYYANPNLCLQCGSIIEVHDGENTSTVRIKKFCNSSCAATYNDAKTHKRQRTKVCKLCKVNKILSNYVYCDECKCKTGCKFCKRIISNPRSLTAHEMCCKKNPERITHKHSSGCGGWSKGKLLGINKTIRERYPNDEVFVVNSTYPRHSIKRRILQDNLLPYICSICGTSPEWNGKSMVLLLDHINGINNDNRLENLRFVCSNCDSQLPTYKSRNRQRK